MWLHAEALCQQGGQRGLHLVGLMQLLLHLSEAVELGAFPELLQGPLELGDGASEPANSVWACEGACIRHPRMAGQQFSMGG